MYVLTIDRSMTISVLSICLPFAAPGVTPSLWWARIAHPFIFLCILLFVVFVFSHCVVSCASGLFIRDFLKFISGLGPSN
jgi:hypothetical protein